LGFGRGVQDITHLTTTQLQDYHYKLNKLEQLDIKLMALDLKQFKQIRGEHLE
jgi:hypothetical protein